MPSSTSLASVLTLPCNASFNPRNSSGPCGGGAARPFSSRASGLVQPPSSPSRFSRPSARACSSCGRLRARASSTAILSAQGPHRPERSRGLTQLRARRINATARRAARHNASRDRREAVDRSPEGRACAQGRGEAVEEGEKRRVFHGLAPPKRRSMSLSDSEAHVGPPLVASARFRSRLNLRARRGVKSRTALNCGGPCSPTRDRRCG